MDYFPMFADLRDQPCLIVGGGEVAARKIRLLRRAGTRITVCGDSLCADVKAMADTGEIQVIDGPVDADLIAAHLLIVAATSEPAVNTEVARLAREQSRLCNVVDDGDASSFIVPSVIDRSPLTIAVSSGGRSPVLARWLRQFIEAALPGNIQQLARWAGDKRRRVQQHITDYDRRVHFWQDILDGPVADQVMAGKLETADAAFDAELGDATDSNAGGEAWLIGAGPGDPELITRRGMQLLQRCDTVLYDRLAAPALLDLARRDAELINVGKQPGRESMSQEQINRLLVSRVASGQRVCRLKGGDPYIFGRGGEEIAALVEAGLPWQVVPGISAAQGCAAAAGIPLTYRQVADTVSLVTGHTAPDGENPDWSSLANPRQTVVLYMGVNNLPELCRALVRHGRAQDEPVAIVENGTTPRQRVVGGTLATIPEVAARANLTPPAIIIVGKVVGLAPAFMNLPLDSAAEVA